MPLTIARYRLPLREPLVVGGVRLTHREGALLQSGEHLSDVAPLPGLSTLSLDEELAAHGPAHSWAMYALTLRGNAQINSARLVVEGPPVAARTVKLKVGRRVLDEDVRRVLQLKEYRGIRIRLDGNRALSLEDAQRLADAAGEALEFFEEPVALADLDAALDRMPIGLDESLHNREPDPRAHAVVLKPTALGKSRTLALCDWARARAKTVVISSCYESAVGRASLARFAAEIAPDVDHGLDTGRAFLHDVDPAALDWRAL